MGIFTEVGNPSNRYEFPPLKIDEFIPFVALKPQRVKDAMKQAITKLLIQSNMIISGSM